MNTEPQPAALPPEQLPQPTQIDMRDDMPKGLNIAASADGKIIMIRKGLSQAARRSAIRMVLACTRHARPLLPADTLPLPAAPADWTVPRHRRRPRRRHGRKIALILIAIAAAVVFTAALLGGQAHAQAVTGNVCGLSQRADQVSSGGVSVLSRSNAFNTDGHQFCISPAPGDAPGFTIANNLPYDGQWQAYPYTGWGCAYSLCTAGAHPIQLSKLPTWANASFSWRPNGATGIWNSAFDDWIDKTGQTVTEDDGAELMIWLKTPPGYCFKPGYVNCGQRLVHIGHRTYWFGSARDCDKAGICWNYLQFRTTRTVYGVKQLWLRPFLKFLEDQRMPISRAPDVRARWYLTSIHAGPEVISGGKKWRLTWFNAHV